MSTTYHVIPLEDVIKAGLHALHFQDVSDVAADLVKRLNDNASGTSRFYDSKNSHEQELGQYSVNQFHLSVNRDRFREIMTGQYLIFGTSYADYYTSAQFIDKLREWKFDVDSWMTELPK